MSDNELRDRIARVLFDRDQVRLEQRGYFKIEWGDNVADWDAYVKPWLDEAQAVIDDLGLTAEAVERMAEAIYRSHDSYTHFTAKPWDEMVKSKDRANKFRVKQDRKAARAAIDALLGQEPQP